MKPQENQDIRKTHVAKLRGGDVEPVSKLAAREADQRAELFALDEEERELLAKVLSPEDGLAGEDDG